MTDPVRRITSSHNPPLSPLPLTQTPRGLSAQPTFMTSAANTQTSSKIWDASKTICTSLILSLKRFISFMLQTIQASFKILLEKYRGKREEIQASPTTSITVSVTSFPVPPSQETAGTPSIPQQEPVLPLSTHTIEAVSSEYSLPPPSALNSPISEVGEPLPNPPITPAIDLPREERPDVQESALTRTSPQVQTLEALHQEIPEPHLAGGVLPPAAVRVDDQMPPGQSSISPEPQETMVNSPPSNASPPLDEQFIPFHELLITEDQKEKIDSIVHASLTANATNYPEKKILLEKLVKETINVHALKAVEYLIKHPNMRQFLNGYRSYPNWNLFIRWLNAKMDADQKTLPVYMIDFARSLDISLSELHPLFHNKEWNQMVLFLLDVKMGRRLSHFIETAQTLSSSTDFSPQLSHADQQRLAFSTHVLREGPTLVKRIQDLALTDFERLVFEDLLAKYVGYSRLNFLWKSHSLKKEWELLKGVHPLKLLTTLLHNEEWKNSIRLIFQTWGTKQLFLSALSSQFEEHSFDDLFPYLQEFCEMAHLERSNLSIQVQIGDWESVLNPILKQALADKKIENSQIA